MKYLVTSGLFLLGAGCSLFNDLSDIQQASSACPLKRYSDAAPGADSPDGGVSGCVPAQCQDERRNGLETDVDCGGDNQCRRCEVRERCSSASDCRSGTCLGGLCAANTCTDELTNGTESDLNCGGDCPPCAEGQACGGHSDCESRSCFGELCIQATCDDSLNNGEETGIDCGGSTCPDACGVGQGCRENSDCISSFCDPTSTPRICRPALCDDGVQNGLETDIDCGGGECDLCGQSQGCVSARDCESATCDDGVCRLARCDNGKQDGDETDVDCGGLACPGCEDGGMCEDYEDCASSVCSMSTCAVATCSDGIQNNLETDVDCGGRNCPLCAANQTCEDSADCETGVCLLEVCRRASCADDRLNGNETDVDCGGDVCAVCDLGQGCLSHDDCESRFCSEGLCLERSNGLLGEYYRGRRFDELFLQRVDPSIDFDWGSAAPIVGMPADNFSVRWRGEVRASFSETYEFCLETNDGQRLWLAGQLLIDNWDSGAMDDCASVNLTADTYYPLQVEVFEAQSLSKAFLRWQSPSQRFEIIATSNLMPTDIEPMQP